jgi:hypothetical protein
MFLSYLELLTKNLFNICSFTYSSQPIRLCVCFLNVWEKWYVQSEAAHVFFMCEKNITSNDTPVWYVYNKQKTAWKVLHTVVMLSLWRIIKLIRSKTCSFVLWYFTTCAIYSCTFHEVISNSFCSESVEGVTWIVQKYLE